jgi:hypothetical protein
LKRNIWLFCATVLAAQAYAQTWVSATGSDSNACTRSAPCKTYQHAHDVSSAYGKVTALDAGDFGPVTVTKSITIDGAGLATNLATGTSEITVNAGAGDIVQLRNLSIHGRNAATGITFNSGAHLEIDDVTLNGFTGSCIAAVVGGSGTSDMVIKDTNIDYCANTGVFVSGVGPTLTVEIVNSHVHYAQYGIYAYSGLITISGSSFSSVGYGTGTGILENFHSPTLANQKIMVDNCQFSGYSTAIYSGDGIIQLSRTTLANNTTALAVNAGSIVSNGNNAFFNNGSNGSFTSTVALF